MKRNNIIFLTLGLLLVLGLSNCKDELQLDPPRLFRPVLKTSLVIDNKICVRWESSKNINIQAYLIEVSLSQSFNADSLVQTLTVGKDSIDKWILNNEGQYQWVENLEEQTLHYYRVSALAIDPKFNSKPEVGSAITGRTPSLFNVTTQDIGFTEVQLRWIEAEDIYSVDNIIATNVSNSADVINQQLTSDEVLQRATLLKGLSSGQLYSIKLRKGTIVRSSITIRTASTPEGLRVILPTENMKEIIESAASGATFMLKGDTVYRVNSGEQINLTKNVTIIGEPGKAKSKVYIQSFRIGGEISVDVEIDSIRIEGIEVTGYKVDINGNELNTEIPNYRFINFDPPSGKKVTLGKLALDNIYMRNYQYDFIQVRTPILRLGELSVNNCVVYDGNRRTGGYTSFMHLSSSNNTDVAVNKIKITNSTFINLLTGLIELRKYTKSDADPNIHKVESVEIINCTFDKMGIKNETPGIFWGAGSAYARNFVIFTGYSNVPVKIENCAFGELSTTYGFLSSLPQQNAQITITNSVQSSDCLVLFGATSTETPVLGLFPNREEFKFNIPTTFGFYNVGDPRWK